MSSTSTAPASDSKTYTSHCHCGANACKVTVSPPLEAGHEVSSCNCTICVRSGYGLIYVPEAQVEWTKGGPANGLNKYKFGKERIGHYFCPSCGTSMCCTSQVKGFFEGMWAINVRCFDDIDGDELKYKKVDGKSF